MVYSQQDPLRKAAFCWNTEAVSQKLMIRRMNWKIATCFTSNTVVYITGRSACSFIPALGPKDLALVT